MALSPSKVFILLTAICMFNFSPDSITLEFALSQRKKIWHPGHQPCLQVLGKKQNNRRVIIWGKDTNLNQVVQNIQRCKTSNKTTKGWNAQNCPYIWLALASGLRYSNWKTSGNLSHICVPWLWWCQAVFVCDTLHCWCCFTIFEAKKYVTSQLGNFYWISATLRIYGKQVLLVQKDLMRFDYFSITYLFYFTPYTPSIIRLGLHKNLSQP